MIKFLKWMLGFKYNGDPTKVEIDRCKYKYEKFLKAQSKLAIKTNAQIKYLVAKRLFRPVQMKIDLYSCYDVIDTSGLPLYRLNNSFWKRPEVQRQLEASKRWR
ncbi:hypothetical protein VP14_059 [Vibrio phage VPMCC14]|nr:hypothetical protein VP14_059 [Vibrio phage VPMCC14]